jgi:hypothetical protein
MFDPDDNQQSNKKAEAFQSLIDGLEEQSLYGWDRDFIDDLSSRVHKHGAAAVANSLTARQIEQLERIKEKCDYEEESKNSFLN